MPYVYIKAGLKIYSHLLSGLIRVTFEVHGSGKNRSTGNNTDVLADLLQQNKITLCRKRSELKMTI